MEALNKVIFLSSSGKFPYIAAKAAPVEEPISAEEEECLIEKARKLLSDMEDLWETDHGAVKLRDDFHLLRYYLNRLPARYDEEGNSKE